MQSFEDLRKHQKLAGVLVSLLFMGLTILSVYGLFHDSFTLEMRRATYFFDGFNKIVFCLSALLLNGTMSILLGGGVLVVLGVLPKRAPGTLNDKLIIIPLCIGFFGIVFSLIVGAL